MPKATTTHKDALSTNLIEPDRLYAYRVKPKAKLVVKMPDQLTWFYNHLWSEFTLGRNNHPKNKATSITTRAASPKQGENEGWRLPHETAEMNKPGICYIISSSCS